MVLRLDMGETHDIGAPGIDHDQPGAGAQPLLHARGKHRVRVGRVGADDQDDVGVLDRIEICVPAEVPNVVARP